MTSTPRQAERARQADRKHGVRSGDIAFGDLTIHVTGLRHHPCPGFALEIERLILASGAVHCVLGPTGAGKTTLLRLLAGLEQPHHGQIWVEDSGTQKVLAELRGQSAAVFQRPMLVSGTVDYNIELGLRFQGMDKRQRRARVAECLELLRMEHLSRRSVRRLSGGEIRLVALARALAIKPRVLLLDEPTADLDPVRVQHVEEVVRTLCHEMGTLVVWTTHALQQARRVADRVVLLQGGKLKRAAAVKDFFGALTDEELQWLLYG